MGLVPLNKNRTIVVQSEHSVNGNTMNKISRFIVTMLIFTFMALALLACESLIPPVTGSIETPRPVYAAAQSTSVSGQNEMMELSHQATVVGLNMDQAANAAAQTTLDYYQRQLMELSIRGTEVSQNMAQAAATQQFIAEQTQMAWNATATAQSQAATAIYSGYILNVTQTAQAQAILDLQAVHTAQANATLTAYSLTATPWAAIQAEIVRIRDASERQAWWGEFVVTPIKLVLFTLVVFLLILGGVMAYQRLIPVLELRLRTISHDNDSPLLLVDGKIVNPVQRGLRLPKQPLLTSDKTVQVEIIDPSEPSITNWITEAEQKLRSDRRIHP
jgi:hypothetical protein